MWIMVLKKISQPEDACSFRRQYYGWRFDSIELKQVAKVLKIRYQKISTFLQLKQQVSFDLLIFFLLGIGRNARLDFGFPSNFTATANTASNSVMFGLSVLLTFFQIFGRWLLLLKCYIAKLAGKKIINQPSHSQNFSITSWVTFQAVRGLIMNFIADFQQLGLTDMCNNGYTVPWKKLSESVRITI